MTDAHAPGRHLSAPPPATTRRPGSGMPGDRIVRQVTGIVAWNAAMRLREQNLLGTDCSRDGRMDVVRRLDVLRRTHAAMADTTARGLALDPGPMMTTAPTAVVAHSHVWFRDKVSRLLSAHGFETVGQTDNAADALGIIVAEQPDLVLVEDRLAMMTGAELLAETGLFSPLSVRVAQADDDRVPSLREAGAHAVVPRQVLPTDLADDALRLVTAAGQPGARP